MRLKTLILIVVLLSTSLPLVIFNFIYISLERQLLLDESVNKLQTVANINHARIKSLLANKNDAVALIKSRTQFRKLLKKANTESTPTLLTRIQEISQHAINASPNVYGIIVYDNKKSLIYSSQSELASLINPDDLKQSSNTLNVKLHFVAELQLLILIDPIYFENELIGYITVTFNDQSLKNIVSDYQGLGDTGEIVLASRDKNGDAFFLTPTRHDPTVALSLTIPKSNLEIPITHAMNGENSLFPNYVDYRGIPVLAISHHIPETDWGMVVKIDKVEVFQNIEQFKQLAYSVLVGTLVVSAFISIYFSKNISRLFLSILSALKATANGQNVEITEKSNVLEVSEVYQAINRLNAEKFKTEEFLHNTIAELTELNSKLDAEAERFKRWKESNFIGIIHSTATGQIIDTNSTLLDMIGYSQEDLEQGRIDWKNLTPEEFLPLDLNAIDEANEKGFWTPFEKAYRHKDGHLVPILIGGSIFDKSNQEFIVFIINLSDKYQKMQELEQYKGIVENSRDMFAFLDLEYRFKAVNQPYLDLHKKSKSDVIDKTISDILGDTFFEQKLKGRIDYALKGHVVSFTENITISENSTKSLKASYIPYYSKNNEIIGFIFKGEDITELEQKQKLIELREAEQKHIIESMLEGIFTTDIEGKILSFNPEAENIFGYKESEIIGQSVDILTDGVSHHTAKIEQFIKTGNSQIINNSLGRDVRAKHKNGNTFPIRIAVASMPLTEEGEQHFIANFQDMSEHEQQTKLLNRSLKLESLGNIAGGVAHDFNNILSIIVGYTNLITDHNKDPLSCMEAIEKACERGQKLTSNLLTFAKTSNRFPVSVNINDLIRKNEKLLETALTTKVKLNLNLDDNLKPTRLEEHLFEDLLLNMAINAMHAIKTTGYFTISTKNRSLSQDEVSFYQLKTDSVIQLTLTDNGCGISQENIDKIFDPFFTTKKEFGNGLGLSQCYGFIKASGGAIDVSSRENQGTTFTIFFPVVSDSKTQQTETDDYQPLVMQTHYQNILVVDDEYDIRFLVKSFLENETTCIFEASSVKEALIILAENKVDLVISDVLMPDTDGISFIEMTLKKVPNLNYLFISGYLNAPDDSGIIKNRILYKPFNKAELIEKINSLNKMQ
ncbi:PAS domain S-box protein [Pseudoalteromonas spongiae]|uniref:PAS domain S-box protein n=1 Tax=Pseudoalteromonas spongiae TaxID=298657 RepID=UPI000C2D09CE|nr:PAS domain S-box protein [Pseudoalteromonas spongiae]